MNSLDILVVCIVYAKGNSGQTWVLTASQPLTCESLVPIKVLIVFICWSCILTPSARHAVNLRTRSRLQPVQHWLLTISLTLGPIYISISACTLIRAMSVSVGQLSVRSAGCVPHCCLHATLGSHPTKVILHTKKWVFTVSKIFLFLSGESGIRVQYQSFHSFTLCTAHWPMLHFHCST